jgi:hypothetical protein
MSCCVTELRDSTLMKYHNAFIFQAVELPLQYGFSKRRDLLNLLRSGTSQKTRICTYGYCISISEIMGCGQEDRVSISSWGIVHPLLCLDRFWPHLARWNISEDQNLHLWLLHFDQWDHGLWARRPGFNFQLGNCASIAVSRPVLAHLAWFCHRYR